MDIFIKFLFMAGILAMGVSIHDTHLFFQAFLFAYVLASLVQLINLSKISLIPRARNFALILIMAKGIVMTIATLLALAMPDDSIAMDWIYVYIAVYFLQYFTGWAGWVINPQGWNVPIPIYEFR